MKAIDFWYSIGSTYSYLTVMRLPEIEGISGIRVRWRPFNVRHIMVEQNNVPFKDKPVKTAYMWRDIQRRSALYGLNPTLPAPYPLPGLELANRIAVLGAEEGWVKEYTRATYRHWFEEGRPAGEEPNISASLKDIGLDPAPTLAAARSERISDILSSETSKAMKLGIFGAPTFAVEGELFWGDDRLEDALQWAKEE